MYMRVSQGKIYKEFKFAICGQWRRVFELHRLSAVAWGQGPNCEELQSAESSEAAKMSDKKAVIKNADMSEEMQQVNPVAVLPFLPFFFFSKIFVPSASSLNLLTANIV